MSDEQANKQRLIDDWNRATEFGAPGRPQNMWAVDVDLHFDADPPYYIIHLQEFDYWGRGNAKPVLNADGRTDQLRVVLPSPNPSLPIDIPPFILPE